MAEEKKKPQEEAKPKVTKGKPNSLLGIVFFLIFVLLALFTLVTIFIKKEKEENKRISLETDLGKSQKLLEEIQGKFNALETELADVKAERDTLKVASGAAALEKKALEDKVKATETEIEQLKKSIAEKQDANTSLEGKLTQLNTTVLEMVEKINSLKKELVAARQEVENNLPVQKKDPPKSAPPVEGFIWTTNEVHNFVVISVGEKDKVSEGMLFDVLDQNSNTKIGKIEIKNIRESMSVADIVAKTQKIKKGDKVRLSPAVP